jgi:Fur family ferric uptake transcriptional regulator
VRFTPSDQLEAHGRSDRHQYNDKVSKPQTPVVDQTGDATTVEGVLDMVRRQGGRVTASRRFLLRALFSAQGHRTAEDLAAEVHAQAPDIHLSTIYRNLEELERLGVIVHSHLGHGPATYHLAASTHGHLVCEECGTMIEAPDALFKGLAKAANAQFGFTIDPHHFAMLGRCATCNSGRDT